MNEWAKQIADLINNWGFIHALLLLAIAGELGVLTVIAVFKK